MVRLNLLYNSEAEKYLNLKYAQLESMSVEECAIGALLLDQYSAFLLREKNRANVDLNWCNTHLDYIVAQQFNNYKKDKYDKYEVVRNLVIKGDSSAQKLMRLILDYGGVVTSLNDIHVYVANIARRLDGIKYVRLQRKE